MAASLVPVMTNASKNDKTVLLIVFIGGGVFAGLMLIGVLAAIAIPSFRRYVSAAKEAEGRGMVAMLSTGIARCATQRALGGQSPLPPTSGAVPDTLSTVSGRKYLSAPSDWSDDAFKCASFEMREPQYFQYQWVRDASGKRGTVVGKADFDADGSPDITLEIDVVCGTSCEAGVLRMRR